MNNKTGNNSTFSLNRRALLKTLLALGFSGPALTGLLHAEGEKRILKRIPASNEMLPAIGVGTSRTFDALGDAELMQQLAGVLQIFFNNGGSLVDSSPMYGSAEAVIGKLLKQTDNKNNLFAATKVWIDGKNEGIEQMEQSRQLWGIKRFDLIQIHNLRDWKVHYETLTQMKEQGKIRYIGITTSHGRFHSELEELLRKLKFDFLQLTYNMANRNVENRLLPIALDKGIAVIANRPYQRGDLFRKVKGKSLPDWAAKYQINSWGQYFLKFIISHPAITCAIPATTKAKHMLDNMAAQLGELPDKEMRKEMLRYISPR